MIFISLAPRPTADMCKLRVASGRIYFLITFLGHDISCMHIKYCASPEQGSSPRTSHDMKWDTIRTLWLRVQIGIREDSVNYRLLDTLFFTYINYLCISWKRFSLKFELLCSVGGCLATHLSQIPEARWDPHITFWKEKNRRTGYSSKFKKQRPAMEWCHTCTRRTIPAIKHLFRSDRKLNTAGCFLRSAQRKQRRWASLNKSAVKREASRWQAIGVESRL
jgi:hypothetical protein